jgi:hypothetical protein
MAKAKKDGLKELKAIGEELFEILTPEDPDTGEEMELDEFLKGSNKKLTENGLIKTLTEACEALEEEDGDDASEELMAFMEEHDIDIPWDSDEDDDDPDEEEDPDDEDEEEPDDDEEDDDESPDFSKMNIKELKAFAKENKIKGIAGLKKDELIELIESALEDEDPDDEEEPDDVDEDDIDEDDVDDEDEDDEYDELSLKEIKALMKKAGHSPKSIKKMDREEMIEHLKAADDEDDDDGDEEEKEMSLEEILNETTKLADLQALVAEHDEFKGIRKKAKKIKGLQGPRELKPLMYKALGVEAPAKKAKVKKEKGPRTVIPGFALKRRQFEASLISTGKYTNETLKKAVLKQYPNFNELSLKTEITDGKNPDYCKFDFPIVEDKKTKKLSFGTFKKDHFEI